MNWASKAWPLIEGAGTIYGICLLLLRARFLRNKEGVFASGMPVCALSLRSPSNGLMSRSLRHVRVSIPASATAGPSKASAIVGIKTRLEDCRSER
ncbi:hypothetical protein KCP70_04755 [Salmonella enterica subsp. enterica]|nr:hypothetical protein KCP70_04755 [Salmonella enterica subsp. enterica]